MFYVYMQDVDTGKTNLVGGNFKGIYETKREAVECITSLYVMDSRDKVFRGQYYYFIQER